MAIQMGYRISGLLPPLDRAGQLGLVYSSGPLPVRVLGFALYVSTGRGYGLPRTRRYGSGQILLNAVKVFNMVSSPSQKQQSVKFNQEGFEVLKENYPTNEQAVLLDCVWEMDKFVLQESINKRQTNCSDMDVEISVVPSTIQYQSIEALLGDDESGKVDSGNSTEEGVAHICWPHQC